MTDQKLIVGTLRQVGVILGEHMEVRTANADEVINELIALLETQELADAMGRLERG